MSGYDEAHAFLCACKGEPYSAREWEGEVERLQAELDDAREKAEIARTTGGYCLPERFRSASRDDG